MSRASEALFDELHGLLTQSMIDDLKRYRASGEPIPPAFYAQCIKLLKDNGIDSPARVRKLLDVLNDEIPDFEDDLGMASVGATH